MRILSMFLLSFALQASEEWIKLTDEFTKRQAHFPACASSFKKQNGMMNVRCYIDEKPPTSFDYSLNDMLPLEILAVKSVMQGSRFCHYLLTKKKAYVGCVDEFLHHSLAALTKKDNWVEVPYPQNATGFRPLIFDKKACLSFTNQNKKLRLKCVDEESKVTTIKLFNGQNFDKVMGFALLNHLCAFAIKSGDIPQAKLQCFHKDTQEKIYAKSKNINFLLPPELKTLDINSISSYRNEICLLANNKNYACGKVIKDKRDVSLTVKEFPRGFVKDNEKFKRKVIDMQHRGPTLCMSIETKKVYADPVIFHYKEKGQDLYLTEEDRLLAGGALNPLKVSFVREQNTGPVDLVSPHAVTVSHNIKCSDALSHGIFHLKKSNIISGLSKYMTLASTPQYCADLGQTPVEGEECCHGLLYDTANNKCIGNEIFLYANDDHDWGRVRQSCAVEFDAGIEKKRYKNELLFAGFFRAFALLDHNGLFSRHTNNADLSLVAWWSFFADVVPKYIHHFRMALVGEITQRYADRKSYKSDDDDDDDDDDDKITELDSIQAVHLAIDALRNLVYADYYHDRALMGAMMDSERASPIGRAIDSGVWEYNDCLLGVCGSMSARPYPFDSFRSKKLWNKYYEEENHGLVDAATSFFDTHQFNKTTEDSLSFRNFRVHLFVGNILAAPDIKIRGVDNALSSYLSRLIFDFQARYHGMGVDPLAALTEGIYSLRADDITAKNYSKLWNVKASKLEEVIPFVAQVPQSWPKYIFAHGKVQVPKEIQGTNDWLVGYYLRREALHRSSLNCYVNAYNNFVNKNTKDAQGSDGFGQVIMEAVMATAYAASPGEDLLNKLGSEVTHDQAYAKAGKALESGYGNFLSKIPDDKAREFYKDKVGPLFKIKNILPKNDKVLDKYKAYKNKHQILSRKLRLQFPKMTNITPLSTLTGTFFDKAYQLNPSMFQEVEITPKNPIAKTNEPEKKLARKKSIQRTVSPILKAFYEHQKSVNKGSDIFSQHSRAISEDGLKLLLNN